MVAMFIVSGIFVLSISIILTVLKGAIGVLDRKDMDHFAHIFLTYQKVGECKESDVEGRDHWQHCFLRY